eukprot:TRINITY_DN5194_c1_g1_i6.p1 TRINITY_DN5194_c1_g1~~TRINITY_DN5194_c1_g1_i6.p1  ORF type:complete len:138 (-),score=22.21 TRINITY_DN5194_c1_g1_i6:316-729(-)
MKPNKPYDIIRVSHHIKTPSNLSVAVAVASHKTKPLPEAEAEAGFCKLPIIVCIRRRPGALSFSNLKEMALMTGSISSIARSRSAIAAAVKKDATTGNPNALAECMEALITVLKYALKQIKGVRSIFVMFLVTRQRE